MRYGHTRVSTEEQNLGRQRVALAGQGCAQVIEETDSGVKARKRLDSLLAKLMDGDELIVSEIDRLGRTTADVILMMDELTRRGIALKVMGMPSLDITSDDGRLIANIVAPLAAHERRRTRHRQAEGIAAAKKAKRHLGRPHKMNGQQIAEARARIEADEPMRTVAIAYSVDVRAFRSTLARTTRISSSQ